MFWFFVFCNFHNFNWVQIDMNQVLSHSFMMLPLPRFIHSFQKERGAQIITNHSLE